jgi:hypothetical protein
VAPAERNASKIRSGTVTFVWPRSYSALVSNAISIRSGTDFPFTAHRTFTGATARGKSACCSRLKRFASCGWD